MSKRFVDKTIKIIKENSSYIKFSTGVVISSLCVSYMMYDTHNSITRHKQFELEEQHKLIDLMTKVIDERSYKISMLEKELDNYIRNHNQKNNE